MAQVLLSEVGSASDPVAAASTELNPGVGMRPADLAERWQRYTKRERVTEFKGTVERAARTEVRCFSNFFVTFLMLYGPLGPNF